MELPRAATLSIGSIESNPIRVDCWIALDPFTLCQAYVTTLDPFVPDMRHYEEESTLTEIRVTELDI